MRFLKPLLAGAALLTLTVPALASADPAWGDRGHEYQRDGGYDRRGDGDYGRRDYARRDYGRGEYGRGDWGDRGYAYRDDGYREHRHYWRWWMQPRWERYHNW